MAPEAEAPPPTPASLCRDQPVPGYRGLGAGMLEVEARLAPLLATALLSSWRERRGSELVPLILAAIDDHSLDLLFE